ncbi:type II toxin-antitoxin system RelB/DinJ family antitoxin [Methylocella silvestris]|uniref:Type II toxin-antitoxin system antitoxin, RelB/DinJ family n=1 Tax=Methylocella silvestris TaxID=199596 RepID=A0A2J7TI93_METSI|nr:type II toxin-antitoxin system RelB/DinJ family antitoxin [Methylocella silvestris]PNG26478.1 type II toxin-antitoxin system antitoxin, RelB/DinJ family [Methylocella silvestris]
MGTDSVVRARIDGYVKDAAAAVLADMGLTVSDAIRIMLMKVAAEKALPFHLNVPKEKAHVASYAYRRGRRFKGARDKMVAPRVGSTP